MRAEKGKYLKGNVFYWELIINSLENHICSPLYQGDTNYSRMSLFRNSVSLFSLSQYLVIFQKGGPCNSEKHIDLFRPVLPEFES